MKKLLSILLFLAIVVPANAEWKGTAYGVTTATTLVSAGTTKFVYLCRAASSTTNTTYTVELTNTAGSHIAWIWAPPLSPVSYLDFSGDQMKTTRAEIAVPIACKTAGCKLQAPTGTGLVECFIQ